MRVLRHALDSYDDVFATVSECVREGRDDDYRIECIDFDRDPT